MESRHFLHVFATFDPGGPQVRTARLLELLPSSYRHTIVAMDGRTGCASRVSSSVAMELVAPPRDRGLLRVGRAIAECIQERRPDLLLTYNWGAIEALLGAWLAGQHAVVHHEEGFGVEETDRLFRRRNWLRRALLRRARAVVVPSLTLQRLAKRYWRQPAQRVRYLPNGVDLDRFSARSSPPAGGDVVIGSVASFRPVKNQALLLRAFALMARRDSARLLLYGDGDDLPAARALAAELGIAARVRFAGASADTAAVYGEMDVFALSSRSEQMPIVVLEAMACGLPVAAPDVGDIEAMLAADNRRLVCARDDAAALAAALDELVGDAGLRAALGRANRRRCEEQYEESVCLQRYVELYECAAAGRL